jgi:hypothetical protein
MIRTRISWRDYDVWVCIRGVSGLNLGQLVEYPDIGISWFSSLWQSLKYATTDSFQILSYLSFMAIFECRSTVRKYTFHKLIVAQLVKKFPAIYRTRKLISVSTRDRKRFLSQTNPNHTLVSEVLTIRFNIHSFASGFSECSLPFRFFNQNFACISHIHHEWKCPAHTLVAYEDE